MGLDNLNAFNDSLDVLKANASASGKMIAGAFAGKFKVATDLIGGAVPELAKGFSDLFTSTDIDGATDNLTNKLTDLGKNITDMVSKKLANVFKKVLMV